MNRYGAFGVHLALSLLVFALLAYLVVFIWYPGFFFDSDGGWQGIRIIIAVDLILGPVLTLVVFRAGKPGLKFDLTAIAALQVACLAAGTWVVFSERPLAIVYVDAKFYSMSAGAYTEAGLEVPDLSALPGRYPKWVMIDIPADLEAQSELRQAALASGLPLRLQVDWYRPFEHTDAWPSMAFDSVELLEQDRGVGGTASWLTRHGGQLDDFLFFPYAARYRYAFLGFSETTLKPLGLLATPPPLALSREP